LVAEAARVVGRMLDNFSSYANLTEGVKLSSGGTLAVYKGYEPLSALASEADNKVVGAALRLKTEGKEVVLFTTDANMRTAARIYGIQAELSSTDSAVTNTVDPSPHSIIACSYRNSMKKAGYVCLAIGLPLLFVGFIGLVQGLDFCLLLFYIGLVSLFASLISFLNAKYRRSSRDYIDRGVMDDPYEPGTSGWFTIGPGSRQ
jgi:hypothetical protein